jgi:hypothetical protein
MEQAPDWLARLASLADQDTPRHMADTVGMVDTVDTAGRAGARCLMRHLGMVDTADRDHKASGCLLVGLALLVLLWVAVSMVAAESPALAVAWPLLVASPVPQWPDCPAVQMGGSVGRRIRDTACLQGA